MDGANWLSLWSGSRTDFITPDQIGFGINDNAVYNAYSTMASWGVG